MSKELICGSLSVGIIVLIGFVMLSLDKLEYNTVGLNYSSYFKSVENATYEAGYSFIGLGHDFIPY